jgi:uncharacterized membrane protein YidH (DUF202 family)
LQLLALRITGLIVAGVGYWSGFRLSAIALQLTPPTSRWESQAPAGAIWVLATVVALTALRTGGAQPQRHEPSRKESRPRLSPNVVLLLASIVVVLGVALYIYLTQVS